MSRMFVYAAPAVRATLLECLSHRFGTHSGRSASCPPFDDLVCISGEQAHLPVPSPADEDIIIVAGADFRARVGLLLEHGLHNVFDGNAIVAEREPSVRFLRSAAGHYAGPRAPEGDGLPRGPNNRFLCEPLTPGKVPKDLLFIVNSMPKSGTIWLCAMIEALLGVKTRQQITISHVADIEADWDKTNNHGAVALVRDMRDVVVSWFHDVQRTDNALGFAEPRYPTIENFYDECFIGLIRSGTQFYGGDLEAWLDLLGGNFIPLIRYEDMSRDPCSALRKIAKFWRIDVSETLLRRVADDHALDRMGRYVANGAGYVADLVRRGHIRRGRCGGWQDELPERIARDIEERFSGYQRRLGYQ